MEFELLIPQPGMRIMSNVRFVPGVYDFTDQNGIVIAADHVMIDGNGAILKGGCQPMKRETLTNTQEFGYGANTDADNASDLGFHGIGLRLDGRKAVTISRLNFCGFDIGAFISDSEQIDISQCDFTGCFNDPRWGWDDHGYHGGILMVRTHRSHINNCSANEVWDALNMRYCNHNIIEYNNFAHTTDTGLKLWNASENRILHNDFSYGIRIDPGEVHARDSSSVLIESGSNNNYFYKNDMSHGGDGLFIRVLNGWMSTGNVFEENNCSYANNNAVEAWADHNTYIRNKANYASYGFWLGNSDHTTLIGNEVAYNGGLFHNAPESFGNCGIAIVNGSGSHAVIQGNYIHDNFGPGIAIRHSADIPSYHIIIQDNRITNNRDASKYKGHGIYLSNARFVTFGMNEFIGNQGDEIYFGRNVADIEYMSGTLGAVPQIHISRSPERVQVGHLVQFTAQVDEQATIRWDFGDGTTATGDHVAHVYRQPGLYSVAATANNGAHAGLDAQNVYILPMDAVDFPLDNCTAIGNASSYSISETYEHAVFGNVATCIRADSGNHHTVRFDLNAPMDVNDQDMLYVHMRYVSDSDTDWDKVTRYPVIRLIYDLENYIEFAAQSPMMEMLYASINEEKDNGRLFAIDLNEPEGFAHERMGAGILHGLCSVSITYGGISSSLSVLTVNTICFAKKDEIPKSFINLATIHEGMDYPRVTSSEQASWSEYTAPLLQKNNLNGDKTLRVAFIKNRYYGVELGTERVIDMVSVGFYENTTNTTHAHCEVLPLQAWIEVRSGGVWQRVDNREIVPQVNRIVWLSFSTVQADAVRICFTSGQGPVSIYALGVYQQTALQDFKVEAQARPIPVKKMQVKLNKELNDNGSPLGDLTARVFTLDDAMRLDKCLYETSLAPDQITPYEITDIMTPGLVLTEGVRYALALGQTNRAESRTEGDYYRWIGGHIGCKETFAIFADGETRPSDYNWGTAWLRVVCDGVISDYSHDSEHVGTRFGIKNMDCRYMTFVAPNTVDLLTDGLAVKSGYHLDSDVSRLRLTAAEDLLASRIVIYLGGNLSGRILLNDSQGNLLAQTVSLVSGANQLTFATNKVDGMSIIFEDCASVCEVYELELYQ